MITSAKNLSDEQLFTRADEASSLVRYNTAELLVYLGEIESRGTYRKKACSSMWVYCTERLGMSADVASVRLRAARVGRRYPQVFEHLATGELHVSGLSVLFRVLDDHGFERLLAAARGQSKRCIEELVARVAGQPVVRDSVRALGPRRLGVAQQGAVKQRGARGAGRGANSDGASAPDLFAARGGDADGPAADGDVGAAEPAQKNASNAAEDELTFRVAFTASSRTRGKLREAQDLLRHAVPSGELDEVFYRALSLLVEDVKRRKFGRLKAKAGKSARPSQPSRLSQPRSTDSGAAKSTRPGPSDSRDISRATKRELALRDGYRCSYRDADGHRCSATAFLEFDHIEPRALGGTGTPANVRLLCQPHNQLAAEQSLGKDLMRRKRRARQPPPPDPPLRPPRPS